METTFSVTDPWDSSSTAKIEAGEMEFWIYTGFSVPLALIALYLSVTQIMFTIKNANRKKRYSRADDKAIEKYGNLLNLLSILATTCAFLRAGVDFRLIYGRYNDFGCDLAVKFKMANYALALTSIYFVLWLRQRVFYQHPRLQYLSSKLIRFVSWAISFVIFFGMFATSAVFFALGVYVGTPQGCAVPKGALTITRWFVMIGCTTTFQVCLLTLFIYPLVKHRLEDYCGDLGDDRQGVIISLVKRATVTAVCCVFSDIGFALLVITMQRQTTTLTTFVYDVNIVFNVLCMVLSFGNWRLRLMPWTIPKDGLKAQENPAYSSQEAAAPSHRQTHQLPDYMT